MDKELQILFGALCDGLRQEVRARWIANLVISKKRVPLSTSLTEGREQELAAALASHLRSVGFFVQTESYFATLPANRRPDFRIWLPVNEKYLYLELKPYGWGDNYSYDYSTVVAGTNGDMDKLKADGDAGNLPNGMMVVGFSKTNEKRMKMTLFAAYEQLSKDIARAYSTYQPIEPGPKKVDLQGMDDTTAYAMVGLWVRKS